MAGIPSFSDFQQGSVSGQQIFYSQQDDKAFRLVNGVYTEVPHESHLLQNSSRVTGNDKMGVTKKGQNTVISSDGPIIVSAKNGMFSLDTTGRKRGNHSVDLQTKRQISQQVCSGDYSFIAAGENNMNDGDHSFMFGKNGIIYDSSHTMVGGGFCVAKYCDNALVVGRDNFAFESDGCLLTGRDNSMMDSRYSTVTTRNNTIVAEYSAIISARDVIMGSGQPSYNIVSQSFATCGRWSNIQHDRVFAQGGYAESLESNAYIHSFNQDSQYHRYIRHALTFSDTPDDMFVISPMDNSVTNYKITGVACGTDSDIRYTIEQTYMVAKANGVITHVDPVGDVKHLSIGFPDSDDSNPSVRIELIPTDTDGSSDDDSVAVRVTGVNSTSISWTVTSELTMNRFSPIF